MSDEEKKAIEYVKNIKSWWWDNSPNRIYSINRTDIEQFDIVLNLIKNQSKEIEELKEKNKFLNWYFENQKENFIHKDKIKAKIEECENEKNVPHEIDFKAFYKIEDLKNIEIAVLQSLLKKGNDADVR